MSVHASRSLKFGLQAATVLVGLAAAGCAPRYSAPVQLQASNPTVTYQYRNDAELLQANQNAAAFCGQYQSTPRTAHIDEAPGGRVVVFECVQQVAVAGPQQLAVTGPVVTTGYNGYYDDYYGPYYDGYWGADGFFYFTDGPGHAFRRDDYHHFRRDMAQGYHGVRGSVHG